MSRISLSTTIRAPREKVWKVMLEDKTYREWTAMFSPGSHYIGDWNAGSKIQFVGPNERGKLDGMTSKIIENRPYEYISIQHLGIIVESAEDTTSDEAKGWQGFENYTFTESEGVTTLEITVDVKNGMETFFKEAWEKALVKLKELAEK